MKFYRQHLTTLVATAGLVAALTFGGAAMAAPGGGMRGHHGQQVGMRIEKMQAELGLTADQVAKIKSIMENNRAEMKALGEQMKSVFTPEQQAQMKTWREGHKKGQKLSKDERKAQKQAFNLTEQQKQQLKTYREEMKAKRAAVRTQVDAVLTPDQKAKLDAKRADWKAKKGEHRGKRGQWKGNGNNQNKDASNG